MLHQVSTSLVVELPFRDVAVHNMQLRQDANIELNHLRWRSRPNPNQHHRAIAGTPSHESYDPGLLCEPMGPLDLILWMRIAVAPIAIARSPRRTRTFRLENVDHLNPTEVHGAQDIMGAETAVNHINPWKSTVLKMFTEPSWPRRVFGSRIGGYDYATLVGSPNFPFHPTHVSIRPFRVFTTIPT